MKQNANNAVNITEMTISNQKHGKENGMLSLKETIGVAYIAVVGRHKFIIRDTQNTILGKSQSNGLFQYANLVMTNNIIDRVKCRTHNIRFCAIGAGR